MVSRFSNMLYGKKRKPGNTGNQQKAFEIKRTPSVNFLPEKTAKKQSLCYLSTILALITKKLPSSVNGKFSLITLSNTLRVTDYTKCLEKCFKSDK